MSADGYVYRVRWHRPGWGEHSITRVFATRRGAMKLVADIRAKVSEHGPAQIVMDRAPVEWEPVVLPAAKPEWSLI